MKQVQHGLFLAEAQMPCLPNDIRTDEGFGPDNFEEEVTTIIVSFSRQANQWVGISIAHLKEEFSMGTFIESFQQLSAGIDELVQKEMLRLSVDSEGEHSLTVVFPTPALISRILQKQRVILVN